MGDWFFVDSPEDDRARHEALEPRLLYSASPIEEPQFTEQPIVAESASPVASGDAGADGQAPAAQDQIPEVQAESRGMDAAQIAELLSEMDSLPAGEVAQIGGLRQAHSSGSKVR